MSVTTLEAAASLLLMAIAHVRLYAGRVILCLALIFIAPRAGQAQRVRGVVVDASTGAPIPAALLTARDSARHVKARRLTTAAGTFDLQFVEQPRTVTVEFVGYTPRTVAITADPIQDFRVALQPAPITLESVVAEAENRCGKSEDPNIATVWYSARAALGSSRVPNTRRYRTRDFVRILDPKLKPEGPDSMSFSVTRGSDSYEAVSADSLAEFGYVTIENGKRFFYGPDAELLLSDAFVNTHCFAITRKDAPPGMVGLEFWPLGERETADIRGVMWLHEATGDLDFVEYTYTGMEDKGRKEFRTGRVDFDRLADRTWVIRNWHIRVPRKAAFVIGAGGRPKSLEVGALEGGGEFLGFDAESAPPDDIGSVTGTVYDSVAGQPMANLPVYLAGTRHETKTDSAGQFRFENVTSGIHYVAFYHPGFAALPLAERIARLEVRRGSVSTASLAIPRAEAVISALCPDGKMKEAAKLLRWTGELGVLTGRVASRDEGIADALVDAEWNLQSPGRKPRQTINVDIKSLTTRTGENGEFTICGLPVGLDTTIRVLVEGQPGASVYVRNMPRVLAKEFNLPAD